MPKPALVHLRQLALVCLLAGASSAHAVCLAADAEALAAPANYYVEARSYGTRRESDPPRYVRTLSTTGIEGLSGLNWLDFGLEHRTRLEYRNNDLRRAIDETDLPVLLRLRAFVAVKEILDPFRFTIEFADARRYHSEFPRDNRDVNEFEPLQAFAELHFKNTFAPQSPLRLRAGRMAFELLDRRLLARNEWRNTANAFQGFRGTAGSEADPWQLDVMALQPLTRTLTGLDDPSKQQWLFAAVANIRSLSRFITLQPYVFWLRQTKAPASSDGKTPATPERSIQAYALRGYGVLPDTGLDYDINVVVQLGHEEALAHRALGLASEAGYTFADRWKTRLSGFYGYGSGDKNPSDNQSNRFERFFGFSRPWSNNDYFVWDNVHAPKLRWEATPAKYLRLDAGYSAYWAASANDRWANGLDSAGRSLRNPAGANDRFIGNEWDARIRWKAVSHVDLNLGYALFVRGDFARPEARSGTSHFAYLELTVGLFD